MSDPLEETFEELVERYDKLGFVPTCSHSYDFTHGFYHQPTFTCPYCKTEFWVGKGRERTMHCPNCCMEINLV